MCLSILCGFITFSNVIICVISVIFWYFVCQSKPARVTFYNADTEQNTFIKRRLVETSQEYHPPFPFNNCHFQLLFLSWFFGKNIEVEREYVDLEDGGAVGIDWFLPCSDLPATAPVLVLLSGIDGNVTHLSSMAEGASRRKYRVVFFNKRGHNNTILKTPKLQALCDARDLRQCLELIRERYPSAKMAAVGVSAGCYLLNRYMSDYTANPFLSACVQIGSGFNIFHLYLTDRSWLYEKLILNYMRKSVIEPNINMLSSAIDMNLLDKNPNTLAHFDYHLYCKMHGYRDVVQYWADHNPMNNIEDVKIPVLCVNSEDDPVCKASNIPYDLFRRPNWILMKTDIGSHCCYYETRRSGESWVTPRSLDYIEAVWDFGAEKK